MNDINTNEELFNEILMHLEQDGDKMKQDMKII